MSGAFSATGAQTRRSSVKPATAVNSTKNNQTSNCKGGWSGSITFKKVIKRTFQDKVKNITRGTTEHTVVRDYDYTGKIQLNDWKELVVGIASQTDNKKPRAQVTVKDDDKNFRRSERRDTCGANSGMRDQWTNSVDNRMTQAFTEGDVDSFNLSVLPFNGSYHFSFRFPDANGTFDVERKTTNGGFCNPQNNGTTDDSKKSPVIVKGDGATVQNQKIDPKNPDVLAGSLTKDTSFGDTKGSITVTWNLRRCPAPLELEAVEFDEHPYPDFKAWRKIESDTVDGNIVRIRARVVNYSNETKFPRLVFREQKADIQLPGGETNISIAPGESREVELLWDTRGYAWETGGQPASDRQIKVEMTEETSPKKEKTGDILIVPRPVILAHGLWADYTAWDGYDRNFKMAHSVAWNSYAVGADPENGVMKTGEKGSPKPTNSIAQNAEELKKQIEFIRKRNNAWHIDIVAHSMGGIISRYYIQNLMQPVPDGVPAATRLVQLGTPNMGSPCASLMGFAFWSLGKPVTALDELRPVYMEYFNRTVRNRNGTKFSVLIGTAVPQTCQSAVSGDGVVEIPSARWEIGDFRYVKDIHTALTDQTHFTNFVLPRLAVSHRIEQNSSQPDYNGNFYDNFQTFDEKLPFVKVSFGNNDDKPQLPENLKIDLSKIVTLSAKQTTEIEFPVAANAVSGVTFAAPSTISATVYDENGAVVGKNSANSAESKADFRGIPIYSKTNAVWKLKLENTVASESSAVVAVWTDTSNSRVSFTVEAGKPNAAGQIPLTAKLAENNAPPLAANVKVQIVDENGKASELNLFDDGKNGDGAAGDGVFGAFIEKLPGGEYSVTSKAETGGRMFVAATNLSIGAEKKQTAKAAKTKK